MDSSPPPEEVPARRPDALPYVPIELYRSAMVRQWGWLYFLVFWYFFRKLRTDNASGERVRVAAEDSTVVYVLRARSLVDYLALNEILRRRRLPLAEYGMAIQMTWYMPLLEAAGLMRDKLRWFFKHGRLPNPVDVGWLSKLVAQGGHAAIFLRPRPRILGSIGFSDWPDPLPGLLEAQRKGRRDIKLLPVAVIWNRDPGLARSPTMRALLGSEDDSGRFARLIEVALGHRDALIRVGEPIDLARYEERYAAESEPRKVRRLRLVLGRFLARESQVVHGPAVLPPARMRSLVMGSTRVRKLVEDEALATQRPPEVVRAQVEKVYEKMAAKPSYRACASVRHFVPWFSTSVYQGFDIREEDLERIRDAVREGVCVLVPCHKSHLDYVLMSMVMDSHDIVIPHVVAGENLAFFPMGAILRRLGAVFIPRTFGNNRVFPPLFQAYLTRLFREGYTLEFFIEGGRSRTGKLLPPRLGVLGATVEAGIEARLGRTLGEVTWLPVAITYERIAEEGPYLRELEGGTKSRESFGAFLGALRVLVRRQGRVYLRVGEPQRLTGFLEELGQSWGDADRDTRKEALQRLAERLLVRIGERMVVVPTTLVAMALLAHGRAGVTESELVERVRRFRALVSQMGGEMSPALDDVEQATRSALRYFRSGGAVEPLQGAEGIVHRIVPDRRMLLDYYKNGALHLFVPACMVAGAIRARGETRFSSDDLSHLVRFQIFLLRYELFPDPESDELSFRELGLGLLRKAGAIELGTDGQWRVISKPIVSEFAEPIGALLESAYVVLRALHVLSERTLDPDALAKEVTAVGRQYLAVEDVRRPEALSQVSLKNALRAFEEDGVYQRRAGGGLHIDESAARETADLLRQLLRRPDSP